MEIPSHLSDPHIVGLATLLDEMRKGYIQVARFQRPLVWTLEQQFDLLRSIREGLPIGSILIWRTRNHNLACYESIGRRRLGRPDSSSLRQYVLDGFQRLSTLYNALGEPDAEVASGDPDLFDFYFDLQGNDFVVGRPASDTVPHLLPLPLLLQRTRLLRRQRDYEDQWVDRSEALFNAFDRYRIPLIPLVTEDLDTATHAFERINRGGTDMSRVHIAHALSWSKDFDLLEELRQRKETELAPLGWGHIEDEVVIDTCSLALNQPIGSKPDQIARALKTQPEELQEAFGSLRQAAEFLRHGPDQIQSPDLVPYTKQIVCLAAAFRRQSEWSPRAKDLAWAWLWLTTYAEVFGTGGSSVVAPVFDSLLEAVTQEKLQWYDWKPFTWRPLPPRLDFRTARARSFGLLLLWMHPRMADGSEIPLPPRVDLAWLSDSIIQLVPRNQLESSVAYFSPGNRFLVPPEFADRMRQALLERTEPVGEACRTSHVILEKAAAHLAARDFQKFINQREQDINRLEWEAVTEYQARMGDAARVTQEPDEANSALARAFLEELDLAEKKFQGGYVGAHYFVTGWKWRPTAPQVTPETKQRVLARLIGQRRVQLYDHKGKKAIRRGDPPHLPPSTRRL